VRREVWTDSLELEIQEAAGYPCIRLLGEGERGGAERLRQAIESLIEEGRPEVIIDARGVRFLDPDSAEVLAGVMERLEEAGGALVIVDQSKPVERALRLLGMEQLAHVVSTPEEAASYLGC
jgi:anti-anti-sigma factor